MSAVKIDRLQMCNYSREEKTSYLTAYISPFRFLFLFTSDLTMQLCTKDEII